MIARYCLVTVAGFRVSAGKTPTTKQQAKPRQPPPPQFARHGAHTEPPQTFHHPNTEPPRNTLNRDSPPPPQFARHGAHTKPPRTYRNPGGTEAYPEYRYMQRCIYPLPRHQGVRALRGRVPCRSKEDICTSSQKNHKIRGTQKSRRFRRISGIFCEVRPLGLEPRTH